MRGITGIRAGRGSHDGIVAVAGGRDDGIDVAVAADGAGMCGVTVVRAGRSRHNGFVGVVRLCQSNVIAVTAVRAGEGFHALCRAGRHAGDLPDIVMAGGRNDGVDVAVAADGAGMRGVTGGGAGRGSDGILIAVAGSRNNGINVAVAADAAQMRGITGGSAGRGSHGERVLMTGSVDIVVAVAVAADGADVVRVAVLLAGRGNDRFLVAVAVGRDKVGLDGLAAGGAGVDRVALLGAGRVDNGRLLQRMLALALSQLLPDKDGIAAVDLLHAGAVSLEGSAELRDEAGGFHGLRRHLYKDGRIMHRGIDHHAEAFEAAGAVVDVFHFKVAALGVVRVHDADGSAGVTGCLQTEVGHGAGVVAVVNVALLIDSRGAGVELADKTADAAVVLVTVAGDRAGVVAVDDVARAIRGIGAAADRADEATDIAVAGDGAAVVGAGDGGTIADLCEQATDGLLARAVGNEADGAGVAGVNDLRGFDLSAETTDLCAAGDRTVVRAGGVGCRLTLGHEAGDVVAVGGHAAVVHAAQEVCVLHRTGKAADVAPGIGSRALLGRDGDVRCDVRKGDVFRSADEAAGVSIGVAVVFGDVQLAGERQVFDLCLLVGRALDIAEEAEVRSAD